MEQISENLEPLPNNQQKEIYQMTKKIVDRYHVYDFNFAKIVATILYQNGIGIDKFKPSYYEGSFYLDEIVIFIINKQKEKSNNLELSSNCNLTKKQNKIINYDYAKGKIMKRKKVKSCLNYQKLKQ